MGLNYDQQWWAVDLTREILRNSNPATVQQAAREARKAIEIIIEEKENN